MTDRATDPAGREVVVRVRAAQAPDEPFSDQDLEAAVRATLREVLPVDGGQPVVPTVEVLDLGPLRQALIDLDETFGASISAVVEVASRLAEADRFVSRGGRHVIDGADLVDDRYGRAVEPAHGGRPQAAR